jgi:hypothetical protein
MREDKLVQWLVRRTPWLALGLAALSVNFLAIAAWRWKVYKFGPQEALLWYEPSPLLAEYEELVVREKELNARWQAGDPNADVREIYAVRRAQQDMYPAVIQDQNARWAAALAVERRMFLICGLVGTGLGLVAVGCYIAYLQEREAIRRSQHDLVNVNRRGTNAVHPASPHESRDCPPQYPA